MSIHLVTCASRVQGISASQKLLLLCLAEDSRDDERHASPGREAAGLWTGLSPSRVSEAMKRLVELRLVGSVSRGHGTGRGQTAARRARYVVFPDGCCPAHGAPETGPPENGRRPLSEKQLAARRVNVERIAADRRERRRVAGEQVSASDAQAHETPVDSPKVRTLSRSQHPNTEVSASDRSESASEGSDPSRNHYLPPTPPTSPTSDVTPPARQPDDTEAAMLVDQDRPREDFDGAYGRPDWSPLAAGQAVRDAAEAFGCTNIAAQQLLAALATDTKVKSPSYLATRVGYDRAKRLHLAATRDPEVTATGHQLAELNRAAASAARPDAARRDQAQAYLDKLSDDRRRLLLDQAEQRARTERALGTGPVPRPLVLAAVADLLEQQGAAA